MSRIGEYYFERIERLRKEKLAEDLGITYDELIQTDFTFETIESNEGLIYEHIIYFRQSSPQEVLRKISGLSSDLTVSLSALYDYDDDFLLARSEYDAASSNENFVGSFMSELENLKELNLIKANNTVLELVLKKQIFIGAITVLETFLSETFINLTNKNTAYFKRFISNYPEFKNRKFSLNEIYAQYDNIKQIARKEMIEVIYHNLAKVKNMYESTFEIQFPAIDELSKSIAIRHDLVHRNGKTKKGTSINIDAEIITDLLRNITVFGKELILVLKIIY